MITDDIALPYERPPLSKHYLRGELDEAELGLVEAAQLEQLGIEVLTGRRAAELHTARAEVRLADGAVLPYGVCLLATGAEPAPLPVPGGEHPGLLSLRTIADARRLRQAASNASDMVVIGSGFIGCEAAASLARCGVAVTLVTDAALPQSARLGEPVGRRIAAWLRDEGVRLVLGAAVTGFDLSARPTAVLDGRPAEQADAILVAGGVRPRAELARRAGLTMRDGRVRTDAWMRSSVPGVLAAGDVAMAWNPSAGRRLRVEHWGEALAMGEVAGKTAAGGRDGDPEGAGWDAVPGFWSEIGDRVLKYSAWGDGFDTVRVVEHAGGAFTAWYAGRGGEAVGVLTHDADADYERGPDIIRAGKPPPEPAGSA